MWNYISVGSGGMYFKVAVFVDLIHFRWQWVNPIFPDGVLIWPIFPRNFIKMRTFGPGEGCPLLPTKSCNDLSVKINWKQESPPAWTQEAYRPPCSEYSFCCPTRVPDPGTPPGGVGGYPDLGTSPPPGGGGYPDLGTPPGGYLTRTPWGGTRTWVPPPPPGGVPGPGYPPGGVPDPGYPPGGGVPDLGTPPGGYLTRVPPRGGYLTRTPPGGVPGPPSPPVWTDKQSETITFPSYYVRGR